MTFLRMFSGCFLQLAPFAFLASYPFINHLKFPKKKTVAITFFLISFLSVLFAGVCCYLAKIISVEQTLFNYANITFFICLVPCFIWYFYAFNEIWQKKLYIFTFTLTSALAITSIANAISVIIGKQNIGKGLPYEPVTLLMLLIMTAIVLPLLLLLLKYSYFPVSDGLSKKESIYLSILSLLLFAMLVFCIVPLKYSTIIKLEQLFVYIVLLITVFACYFVCFKMFFYAHEKLIVQQQLTQMQYQLEIHDEQYKRIIDNIENGRKIRHNAHHHAIVLQEILHSGKIEEAEKYLNQYAHTINEYEIIKICDNIIVNSIVNHYKEIAEEQEITFSFKINMPKQINVENSDISVLLGNLLENAIEAAKCCKPTNKFIKLNIISRGKMLAITADNSFDGQIKFDGKNYISIKANHIGIGLQSINTIAQKYDGGVEFTYEDFVFHAAVMLNMETQIKE